MRERSQLTHPGLIFDEIHRPKETEYTQAYNAHMVDVRRQDELLEQQRLEQHRMDQARWNDWNSGMAT